MKKHLLKPLFLVCLSIFALSCGEDPDPAKSQAVVILTFKGKGEVKAINLEKKEITLDHEEIKGYMEAMVMEFSVLEKSLLDNVKPGDKVEFTLKHEAGIDTITEMRKIP